MKSKLKTTDQDFVSIVENSTDIIARFDTELRYIYCNKAVETILGISGKLLIGKTPIETGGPTEQVEFMFNSLKHTLQSGIVQEVEQYYPVSNEIKYFNTRIIPERDQFGKITTLLAISRDISERKKAEDALLESQMENQALLDATDDSAFLIDTKGNIFTLNEGLANLFKSTKENMLGKCIYNYLPVDLANSRKEKVQECIDSGKPVRFTDNRDGFLIDNTLQPVFDSERRVIRIAIFGRNITENKKAETALKNSEKHYRNLVEGVPGIIYKFSSKRGGLYYSPLIKQILGYSQEELLADPMLWHNSIHPDDIPHIDSYIIYSENKKMFCFEYRIMNKSGNWLWFEDRSIEYEVIDSEVIINGLAIDITSRKKSEQALMENEERYRVLADDLKKAQSIAKIGSWKWGIKSGEITWSDEMYNIFGIDKTSYTGRLGDVIAKVIHPDDLHIVLPSNAPAFAEKKPMEYRIVLPDKSIKHIYAEAGDAILDKEGNPNFMTGIAQDITELKRAYENIRHQSGLIKSLLNSIPDIIFFKDLKSVYLGCNPAFADHIGIPENEIVGKTDYDLYSKEDADYFRSNDSKMLETLQPNHAEEWISYPDGRKILVDTLKTPYWGPEGELIGVLGISRDITQRKAYELQLEESKNRYREAQRIGKMGDVLFDLINNTLSWSEEVYNIFELSPEIFTPTPESVNKYIYPEDLLVNQKSFKSAIDNKKPINIEHRIITGNNRIKYIQQNISFKNDEFGNLKYLINTILDVTKEKQIEEDLRLKSLVLDQIKDHVTITNLDGVITYINQIEVESIKRVREEIIGQKTIIYGEDTSRGASQKEILENTLKEGSWRGEVVNFASDRSEIIMDCRTQTIINDNGDIVALCGISTDITEQKRTNEALKKSEEKFSKAFKTSPEALSIASMNSGRYLEINDAFVEITGFTREEVIGHTSTELNVWLNSDDRRRYIEQLTQDGFLKNFEVQYRMKNNEIRDFLISSDIIDIDGQRCSLNFIYDITYRKKSELELKESEAKYRELVEQTSDAILIIDDKGNYIDVNSGACRMLGYKREELLSMNMRQLVDSKELPKQKDTYNRMLNGENVISERKLLRKDGTYVDTELNARMISNEKFCAVVRDITERKTAEAEHLRLQNLESLGILAGGIAHDFNNILSTILGRASIALDEISEGNLKNDLMSIEKASKRAIGLTQQLLTFARGGAPEKSVVNLLKILTDITNFSLSGSNILSEFDFKSTLKIEADPGQIGQAIQNIVLNAKQAMPSGGKIKISTMDYNDLDNNKFIKIIIEDQGTGIPKEHLTKIFNPYFTTKQTGSGLGLSVCHSIILRHEGRVYVQSEIGKGTTFTLLLPATEKEDVKKYSEAISISQKLNILIMDDEEDIRELLSSLLTRLGHIVSVASKGEEALQIYMENKEKNNNFDLVFMDLTIRGGMGGKETVKKLREYDPIAKVIVSSGYADSSVASYKEDGFDGMLKKPYTKKDLNEVIFKVIND